MPQPWEPGYKPPTAAEVFDPHAPLPQDQVEGWARDWAHQERSNRAEILEAALERIANMKPRPILDPHDCEARLRRIAAAALKEFRR